MESQESGTSADRPSLQHMIDVLVHRDPDGDGVHFDGPVALGHRRLAIIDPAQGQHV